MLYGIDHVRACQVFTKKRFSFPFSEQMVTVLVSYLLSLGTLNAKTIESYISDLRTWHMTRGFFVHNLRSDIIKSLLAGKSHEDLLSALTMLFQPTRLECSENLYLCFSEFIFLITKSL